MPLCYGCFNPPVLFAGSLSVDFSLFGTADPQRNVSEVDVKHCHWPKWTSLSYLFTCAYIYICKTVFILPMQQLSALWLCRVVTDCSQVHIYVSTLICHTCVFSLQGCFKNVLLQSFIEFDHFNMFALLYSQCHWTALRHSIELSFDVGEGEAEEFSRWMIWIHIWGWTCQNRLHAFFPAVQVVGLGSLPSPSRWSSWFITGHQIVVEVHDLLHVAKL